MSASVIIQIILFFCAFIARSFFAGSEIAFLSVDRLAVRNRAHSGHQESKRLDILIGDMQRLISIILIGTNITGTIATVLATSITIELGLFGDNGVLITTILMITTVLIFGEIIPKNYAGKNATVLSLRLTKTIEFCGKVFAPIVFLFTKTNQLLLGKDVVSDNGDIEMTEESIKTMVTIGEEEGDVEESERDMIYGVFDSTDTFVRDIMIPRVNMSSADIEDGLGNIIDIIMESGHSRIPIYEDTIDNIIGIINAKDVLVRMLKPDDIEKGDVRELMREPYFVPETRLAGELMHELRELGVHVAIVLDEYGGTEGLVTLEDIIEEIVGDIHDEYDQEEQPMFATEDDGSFMLDPRLSLDRVADLLEIDIDSDEVDTLAGLIYEFLGRVPTEGEELILDEFALSITVVRVDSHRIEWVRVVKLINTDELNI